MKRMMDPFDRPRTAADLVLVERKSPRPGTVVVPRWSLPYPEVFVRLTAVFRNEAESFEDDPRQRHESSPLFWQPGAPSQILLWAAGRCATWSLSLTRWGVLRWEYRSSGDARPVALESQVPLFALVNLKAPFHVGVTLAKGGTGGRTHVRLLAGTPGIPLAVVAQADFELPAGLERPGRFIVGQGPRRWRPARARVRGLLVAQTDRHALYQGQWRGQTGVSASRHNQGALACRLDSSTVLAYPGVALDSTTGNYWHHLTVTDPAVAAIRFPACNEMATRFYGRAGGGEWAPLPARLLPQEDPALRCLEVLLPRRRGRFDVANCPVYDEARRAADLAEARRLGAQVFQVATSRGGLPVHLVELTDPAVPWRGKSGVALICGQHSPVEQMTGFLGIPLLQELVRLHRGPGRYHGILGRLAVCWIPTFNVDCARWGLPGNTLDGANPNRQWFAGQGPEQAGVQRFMRQRRRQGLRLGLMIDCHGGGLWRNHTVLTHYELPHARVEKATGFGRPRGRLPLGSADRVKAKWLTLMDRHAGLGEVWEMGRVADRLVSAPQWFQATFGCPALTLECSVLSCRDPRTRRTLPLDMRSYRDLGRHLATVLAAGMSKD